MKKSVISILTVTAAVMAATGSAYAADALTLTFSRTGTDASSVTVSAAGVDGVSARLVSVTHALKSATSQQVLCPDVNGNSSPDITFTFSVAGLPAGFSFNQVGLDIHALNASAGYQQADDGKDRQFNVEMLAGADEAGATTIFSAADMDIAAGVNPDSNNRNKVWDFATTSTVSATEPMVLKLHVTKGASNAGCFFGLSSIILSTAGETPNPNPNPNPNPEPGQSTVYTIKWKNNTSSYVTQSDNGMVITPYSTTDKIFWEFIPTENENCYYIRNTATGLYIGSCNLTPRSASKVAMSATPVEYYMGRSVATSGDNSGCYWLSSTDCANYSTESAGARCLNKDGASSSIITWTTGVNNVGSYWTLTETPDLYEARPFTPVDAIGHAGSFYQITDAANPASALTTSLSWAAKVVNGAAQSWYFVGTSNRDGGYQIVDGATDAPAFDGERFTIHQNADGSYSFRHADGSDLSVDGISHIGINGVRSAFALHHQIYQLPCGSKSDVWVAQATIQSHGSALHYPMAVRSGSTISYPRATTAPANKYTILSRDAAKITADGEFTVNVELNKAPGANTTVTLHFDWDHDGVFEAAQTLTPAATITAAVTAPEEALRGVTRMRLRITDNGLAEADDEVHGQVIDFRLDLTDTPADLYLPTVGVNDAHRGTATYQPETATATASAKGTSVFLCWQEGHRVLAVTPELTAEPSAVKRHLTAIFSVNLDPESGIDHAALATDDASCAIALEGTTLHVAATSAVKHILVFATDGRLVAQATGADTLALSQLPAGIYIAKAVTARGSATLKFAL